MESCAKKERSTFLVIELFSWEVNPWHFPIPHSLFSDELNVSLSWEEEEKLFKIIWQKARTYLSPTKVSMLPKQILKTVPVCFSTSTNKFGIIQKFLMWKQKTGSKKFSNHRHHLDFPKKVLTRSSLIFFVRAII